MTVAGGSGPLAITMGEPSGIAAEITAAAWRSLHGSDLRFFSIADPDHLAECGGAPVAVISEPAEAADVFSYALPVLPQPLPAPATPGAPAPENAAAVIRSIERATELAVAGDAAALVTPPISKKALYDGAAFSHPGHTEFLAALGGADRAVMMIASDTLRVVPVTIHIPLAHVAEALSENVIVETGQITDAALRRDFGLSEPRLAIAGLNPHAGEGGAMGREDMEIIAPAVERLRAEGINASGPLPADTMFHPAARARYDVALCMYHDQALIPAKTLAFDTGVNVTLGLPFIRTSPDHGVAFDIAGQGKANPTSMIEAVTLAATLAANRAAG